MTPLHQKLDQLSLTTMSRQLDQMIADAGKKNLSFAQALESLADMELKSRNRHAIERRFRCSRLQAQHSIDSFYFKHHKSRMELKNRIATAIADRLVENSEIFLLGGDSLRKANKNPNPTAE